MALVKCEECGREVSTQAAACPNCGAKPPRKGGSIGNALGLLAIIILVIAVVAALSGKNTATPLPAVGDSARATPSTETKEPAEVPVNFDLALETAGGTLVCSFAAASDVREGHGLKAAMKSRMEIFGRREDAEKAGCEEWQEGLSVRLSAAAIQRAKDLQARHVCSMLEFAIGFVYSCDLRNARTSPASSSSIQPTETTPLPQAGARESGATAVAEPGVASQSLDRSPVQPNERTEPQVEPTTTAPASAPQ